jgi:hypothetical protein
MSNKTKTPEPCKFYFQFNDDEPVFTKISGNELTLTISCEKSIEFFDSKGNAFKIFGRKENEQ